MPSEGEGATRGAVRDGAEAGFGASTLRAVLERLRPALDPFRSAVAEAAEEVRAYRARHEEAAADPVGRMTRELGPFAVGRIDPLRLAGLVGQSGPLDPLTDRLMEVAHERFITAGSGGMGSYRVSVPEGADLRDAVKDALAEVGRAFGTAHAVEKARNRRYQPDLDHTLLQPHPFHRWTPAERTLAPPLVVEVSGSGLRGSGLLEFMEGNQKFVLLVRGTTPPAPLARLASPGVFVAQASGAGGLTAVSRLAGHDGPGVVAIFEEAAGALIFTYAADGGIQLDGAELQAATELAEATAGRPGILDLRYLSGLVAVAQAAEASPEAEVLGHPSPAVRAAARAAVFGPGGETRPTSPSRSAVPESVGSGSPTAGVPSVDQLTEWLLARTELSAD